MYNISFRLKDERFSARFRSLTTFTKPHFGGLQKCIRCWQQKEKCVAQIRERNRSIPQEAVWYAPTPTQNTSTSSSRPPPGMWGSRGPRFGDYLKYSLVDSGLLWAYFLKYDTLLNEKLAKGWNGPGFMFRHWNQLFYMLVVKIFTPQFLRTTRTTWWNSLVLLHLKRNLNISARL